MEPRAMSSVVDGARPGASAVDGAGAAATGAGGAAAVGRLVAWRRGRLAAGGSMEETKAREMGLRNVREEIRLRRGLK
jgi:hypothetical protein